MWGHDSGRWRVYAGRGARVARDVPLLRRVADVLREVPVDPIAAKSAADVDWHEARGWAHAPNPSKLWRRGELAKQVAVPGFVSVTVTVGVSRRRSRARSKKRRA